MFQALFLSMGDLEGFEKQKEERIDWDCGAVMGILITNSNEAFCATLGDAKTVCSTMKGGVPYKELSTD